MYSVTFKGFHTKEHAEAFAAWYDGQGEQASDIWMEASDQPSAYLMRGRLVEGNVITLTIKPKEEF